MCYSIYLSTTSPEDLARHNSYFVRFNRLETDEDVRTRFLENPQKWYVGSKSICSCTFRHLISVELGFDEPQDWYPEDEDDLIATAEVYEIISELVNEGHQVDCLDLWDGGQIEEIQQKIVRPDDVPKPAFRFFENYRFEFIPQEKVDP